MEKILDFILNLDRLDIAVLASFIRNFVTIAGNTILVLTLTESKYRKNISAFYVVMGFLIALIISTLTDTRASSEVEFISYPLLFCVFLVASTILFYTKDSFFQTVLNICTQIIIYFIISYLAYTVALGIPYESLWLEIYIRGIIYLLVFVFSYTIIRKPYRKYIKYLHKGWNNLAIVSFFCMIFFLFVFLIPEPFYKREAYNDYVCVSSIILVIMIYIMFIRIFSQAMQNVENERILATKERQLRYLENQTTAHKENEEHIRKLRHDLRHHDALLLNFLETGKVEQAKAFLAEHCAKIEKTKDMIYCRNPSVNAILSTYTTIATEKGYQVNMLATIPEDISIDGIELSSLIANIIENAVESCSRCKSDSYFPITITPSIDFQCDYKSGVLHIHLQNSCPQPPNFIDGIPQTTKKIGGIGLQSVMSIIEKYDGLAKFEYENHIFITKILLNCPETEDS